jgi:hypothetical protein
MKINEDTFQLAYYLYENKHISGDHSVQRCVVRTYLEKFIDDFDNALLELEAKGFCKRITAGGDNGLSMLTPAGITFVEGTLSNRMELRYDAQLLLRCLYKDHEAGFPWAIGDVVQEQMGWTEKRFRSAAFALSDEGFIKGNTADDNPYFELCITPEGRKAIRANLQLPAQVAHQVYTGDITANITGNNNLVSIGSILSSVTQTIEASSTFSASDKNELKDLLERLNVLLQDVPLDFSDEAETAAQMARSLVENAAKEKLNKPLIKITAEGLKTAAIKIAVVTPQVLTTALAIITFIDKIQP